MAELRFYRKGDSFYAEHPDGRKFRVRTDNEAVARKTVTRQLSKTESAARSAGETARSMVDAASQEMDALTRPAPPTVEAPIEGAPPLGTPERQAWEQEQQKLREQRKRDREFVYDPSNTSFGEYGSGLGMGAIGARIGAEMARPVAPMPYIGPASQVIAPMVGGTIGYGYGLYQSEVVPRAAKAMGLIEDEMQFRDLGGVRNEILDKMGVDITTQAGMSVLMRSLASPARAAYDKLTGLTPEARELVMRAAQGLGVNLGRVNIANSPLVNGYNKVIGRFPFIGTPAKEQGARLRGEFEDATRRLFSRDAPIVTMPEASVALSDAAQKRWKAFHGRAGKLYDDYRAKAATEGDIVPTSIIQDGVINAVKRLREIELRSGDAPKSMAEAYRRVEDTLDDVLTQTADRKAITVQELDGLYEMLESSLRSLKVEGKLGNTIKLSLTDLAQGLETAERAIRPDSEAAQALAKADQFYAKFMTLFDQPIAQKFKRESPTSFRSRTSLTREQARPKFEADEIFDMVFSTRSAEAQRTLQKIVGPKAYKMALGAHIDDVLKKSISEGSFNKATFLEGIGMGGKDAKANALTAAIDAAKIPRERLKLLAQIAEKLEPSDLQDVSTFIQRRATLGGMKSIGTLFAGAGVAAGTGNPIALSIAIPVLLRWTTGELNKPVYDQLAKRLAKYEPGTQTFRNTLVRLGEIAARDVMAETEDEVDSVRGAAESAVRGAERVGQEFMRGFDGGQ